MTTTAKTYEEECECQEARALPNLPGGQFTAIENPDGTWNVLDVPIFCEHEVDLGSERLHVNRQWMQQALTKAHRRFLHDAYMPPLHINHHGTGRDTKHAGFFRLRRVRQVPYEGRRLWTVFADLVNVPPDIYEDMRSGRLPFRSVEVHRIDEPEIDSLSLLDDEVPFFRLALLTIGEERRAATTVGPVRRRAAGPCLAYRALDEHGYLTLWNDPTGEDKMDPNAKTRRYQEDDEEREEKMQDEEILEEEEMPVLEEDADEPDESLAEGGDLAGKLVEVIATLQELADGMMGGGAPPAPVEMRDLPIKRAAKRTNGKTYGNTDPAVLARLDRAEALAKSLKQERQTEKKVEAATRELVGYGLDEETTRKRLYGLAAKQGLKAIDHYVTAARDMGERDPAPAWSGEQGGAAAADETSKNYSHLGAEGIERAHLFGREYDSMIERGWRMDFDRDKHIQMCLEAEGLWTSNGGK